MRATLLLTLALALVLAPLAADAEGIRERRPNFVFGELGGKAVILSGGYERYLNNRVGIGVGAVAWGAGSSAVGLFPVYGVLTPVGETHSLYLSAGVTYIAGVSNWSDDWVEWVGTVSAGYQYQSEGGLFVRPTMTMFFRGGTLFTLPGVAIGGSF